MNIEAIINDLACRLAGTDALIQIQVGDEYYIRRVGDANRLSERPRCVVPADRRPFLEWMEAEVDRCGLKAPTVQNHRSTVATLRAFRPGITFGDLDDRLPQAFEQFLEGRGYAVNTRAKHLKILRRYLSVAVNDDLISRHPFRRFRIRTESTCRETLSEREVSRLEDSLGALEGEERQVAAGFLFSVYSGLRFSDVRRVAHGDLRTIGHHRWLVLRMQKTGREVRVPIDRMFRGAALDLIRAGSKSGCLFPLPRNSRTNILLGRIMSRLGIRRHISFHCARGTCATILLSRRCGLPVIQSILGHRSVTTTQGYAAVRDAAIGREVGRAFR